MPGVLFFWVALLFKSMPSMTLIPERYPFNTFYIPQLEPLADKCFVVRVQPEQELFVQGDDVNHLFILVSGVVRLFAKFPV